MYRRGRKKKGPGYEPDAVARTIAQWQRSPEWKDLKPSTAKFYERGLRWLDEHRRVSIGSLSRPDLLAIRDAIAEAHGNASANAFIATVSALMTFALDRGIMQVHPLQRIKRLKIGEWHRWPDAAIAFALERFPVNLRRAVVLALYTGQRASDCVAMRWDEFDGAGIKVAQEKTGAKLWVACHRDLRAELAAWPRDAVTILTNADGRPWKLPSFETRIHFTIRRYPELDGLVFHGLRKTAAARLAEAGCSSMEIAAITGHATLAMVEHYTREADQRTRASAAILKLEATRRGK